MKEEQRKELIPEVDQLASKAKELRTELGYLLDRHRLYKDESLVLASNNAYKLVASLQAASDALKRANAHRLQAYLTDWYHFRLDEDDGIPDPVFESITYKGNDEWEIIMTTTTHGRERVVVHSNAATWEQVYSTDRL